VNGSCEHGNERVEFAVLTAIVFEECHFLGYNAV
jgi:hypothetical protein